MLTRRNIKMQSANERNFMTKWMSKKPERIPRALLVFVQPVDVKNVSESAPKIKMWRRWNQAVTVVSDQVHDWPSSSSYDSYLWIAEVSNGYVCDICQQLGRAGSKTEKEWVTKPLPTSASRKVLEKTAFYIIRHYLYVMLKIQTILLARSEIADFTKVLGVSSEDLQSEWKILRRLHSDLASQEDHLNLALCPEDKSAMFPMFPSATRKHLLLRSFRTTTVERSFSVMNRILTSQ